MKITHTLLYIITLTLSSSIAFSQAPVRITCIGNSITEGYGNTSQSKAWPAQLEILLGDNYSVLNCGVSGTMMVKKGSAAYWNTSKFIEAKNSNPQILIIKLGTNDTGSGNWKYKSDFYSDYVSMINEFRQNGNNPILYLCFPAPVFANQDQNNLIIKEAIPLIDSVRKYFNSYLIDFQTKLLPYSKDFPDGIHPNDDGSLVMAKIASAVIKGHQKIMSFMSINKNALVETNIATLNVGDDLILEPQPSDGTWHWSGPDNFSSDQRQVNLFNAQLNQGGIYTAIYTSPDGYQSVQNFMISFNNCVTESITPYSKVNNDSWTSATSLTANPGSTINIGPQASIGTWRWNGPNNFFSHNRQLIITNIVASQAGDYSVDYYNNTGCKSSQVYSIDVVGDIVCPKLTPYVNINGSWTQQLSISLNAGGAVSFGPQPSDGAWHWLGPNGFSSFNRETSVKNIQQNQVGKYKALFTNIVGCKDSLIFTIDVINKTDCASPITPYVNINEKSWLQKSNVFLKEGDNITLGPQPLDDGIWNWVGPSNFTSNTREITLSNINPNQTGSYTASFTNTAGCTSTLNFIIAIDVISGLKNKSEGKTGKLYPNPTTGFATLTHIQANATVTVYSLSGQVVHQQSAAANGDTFIDTSHLKAGDYIIRISGKTETTFKLIKQ